MMEARRGLKQLAADFRCTLKVEIGNNYVVVGKNHSSDENLKPK